MRSDASARMAANISPRTLRLTANGAPAGPGDGGRVRGTAIIEHLYYRATVAVLVYNFFLFAMMVEAPEPP